MDTGHSIAQAIAADAPRGGVISLPGRRPSGLARAFYTSLLAAAFFAVFMLLGVRPSLGIALGVIMGDVALHGRSRLAVRSFEIALRLEQRPHEPAAIERATRAVGPLWMEQGTWFIRNSSSGLAVALRRVAPQARVLLFPAAASSELQPAGFSHTFEPVLLKQTDATFRALSDLPPDSVETRARESLEATALAVGGRVWARVLTVVGVVALVFCVVWLVGLVLRSGLGAALPIIVGAACALPLSLNVLGRTLLWPTEWLLVPGGVLVRSGDWRTSDWTLTELRREDCTLVYHEYSGALGIASPEGEFARHASVVEAQTLLRAWFSDAPRQPLERMSDLR